MSGGEALVVMMALLCSFGTIFGMWYLRSRENMALIDRGLNPRQGRKSLPKPFGNLKYGLLLMGAGIGLAIAFLVDISLEHQKTDYNGTSSVYVYQSFEALYFALIAVGGGLGLVISYLIERKAWEHLNNTNAANVSAE